MHRSMVKQHCGNRSLEVSADQDAQIPSEVGPQLKVVDIDLVNPSKGRIQTRFQAYQF